MNFLKQSPATMALMVINVAVFSIIFLQIGSFEEPAWSIHLLQYGAEFNPYTLSHEWYRIFTHMFLHGSVIHLVFNMYALYSVGTEVEAVVGTRKFLWIYFLTGIAAALVSLYWNLFAIGVGASGAIFGLFGFLLIISLAMGRRQGHPITPMLINFGVFLGINLLFAKAFKADSSAHLGGLACGVLLALPVWMNFNHLRKISVEYVFIPLFIVSYFALPRYQVTYFNFFQYVLAAEDSARQMFSGNHTDDYYLQALKKSNARWDTALSKLSAHAYLPKELHRDTLKLRHYIKWNKKENLFRITMIERESYIYLDSIELAQDSIRSFMRLDYPLVMTLSDKKEEPEDKGPVYETVQVFYNAEWEEVPGEPFSYYRIGTRDSLGRWQGRLQDYYANSDVQMKGSYKNDERDGIFIYYSDHKTYQSAGRYRADRSVGKWETYHNNGVLESEVYYTDRYFLKNLWDSTGKQLVKDGYGKVKEQYPNGVVSNEGEYRDGYKEGYWYGRHPSGKMYYEENYYRGRLVNGRSKNVEGETFVYDESSLFPLPVGGYKNLKEYIQGAVKQTNERVRGTVRLSFRVTSTGRLTDFKVLQSISKQADDQAKQIIKSGPQWIPAKNHGCENVDGFAFVDVEFS